MKYIALALALTVSTTAIAEEAFIRLNGAGDKGRVVILSTFAISATAPTMHNIESVELKDTVRGYKDAVADDADTDAFKEGRGLSE